MVANWILKQAHTINVRIERISGNMINHNVTRYQPLVTRRKLVPTCNIGSKLSG